MFKDVKSLLPKTIKKIGISRQLDSVRLIKIFEKTIISELSSDFANKIKVLYIKGKIVSLVSFSSEATRQIKSLETNLVNRANKTAGDNYVEKIRILG